MGLGVDIRHGHGHGLGLVLVMLSTKLSGLLRRCTGTPVLEFAFFVLALLFVLWVAQGVQQHAQDGERRWQKDRDAGLVVADKAVLVPLTVLWCQRDSNLIRLASDANSDARCRSGIWTVLLSWVRSGQEVQKQNESDSSIVLQAWQKEVAARAQQWQLRWKTADAAQINAALTAEASSVPNAQAALPLEAGQPLLSLEPQLPSEVLRLQALSNERMTQWDRWMKDVVLPVTQSPITVDQLEALWSVGKSLDGSGGDVGARMVRQSLRAYEQAARAGFLQKIVGYLPWLLLGQWLFTVFATYWMRARISPLQQFNGLLCLGLLFWFALFALGAAPSPLAYQLFMMGLGLWMVLSWLVVHFYPHLLPPPLDVKPVNASWIPGWWLFTATGWLLLLDQSLNFHERLRFLALEQWWAWCLSAILLPLAALAAPWVLNWVHFLSHALWGRRTFFGVGLRSLVGGLVVSVFYLAHRQNIPQYVTGELLKMVFIVCLCGWCVWKMPLAAQLWHAGHSRTSVRYLLGAMSLMLLASAAAFVTSDKGPLLVMALLLAVLLATVLGWTGGMGLLILGFAAIFLVGVDLDVVGERLQAWRNPFTADRDDMARLMWFQLEAARYEWGFGVGQVPWCGTARLDVCHGLPLQLQSDYTFTAIMGWWGPWGAWAWLLLFSAYVYRALVYCARVSPAVLTPLTLLEPKIVKEVTAIHLLFLFAVLVLMQTWITVAGNLGWLPLTGVTWPLMSYGKSSLWITSLFVGAWGLRRPNA